MFFCSCAIRISTIQFWSAREPFKAIIFTVHPSVLSQNNHKANYSETNRFSIIVNEIIKLFGSVWNIILYIQMDLETFIRKLGAKLENIFAMGCQCSFLGKNRESLMKSRKNRKRRLCLVYKHTFSWIIHYFLPFAMFPTYI